MNKKAFTLIELLAVIVVLAILLVIAAPRVFNVIEEVDKEAIRITGEQLIKAAKNRFQMDTTYPHNDTMYIISNGEFIGNSISMSGKLPDGGKIIVSANGEVSLLISNSKWCATKDEEDEKVTVSSDPNCVSDVPIIVPDTCFSRTSSEGQITITSYDSGCSKNVIIPNTLDGLPVRIIGSMAFNDKQLTSVSIPNTVTTLGYAAFNQNLLTYITIPNSVSDLGTWTFSNNFLSNVTIPSSITTIGEVVFAYNLLTKVTIPNSVTSIGYAAFHDNQLPSVTIPNSVTTLDTWAFATNLLTSVTVPGSITTIEDVAFAYNQLTSVTIPNEIVALDYAAFYDNLLTTVTIPSSVTTMGNSAFGNNQLISATMPSNVTITDSSISSSFYTSYVTNNSRVAGTYTAPSQTGLWTKQ